MEIQPDNNYENKNEQLDKVNEITPMEHKFLKEEFFKKFYETIYDLEFDNEFAEIKSEKNGLFKINNC